MLGGTAVPTYDYRCDRCQRTFEVRQRISEEPLTICEHCGGPIRRLLSAAPFILKGGGWYVTDYPSEGRKKGMEAEKKSSGDASASPAPATAGDRTAADPRAARRSSVLAPASKLGGRRRPPADGRPRADPEARRRAPLPHEHLDPARAVDQRPQRPPRPLAVRATSPSIRRPAMRRRHARRRARQAPALGTFVSRFPNRSASRTSPSTRPPRRRGPALRRAAPGAAAGGPKADPAAPRGSSARPPGRRCRGRGMSG